MATNFFDSEKDMSDMSNDGKGVAYNAQIMGLFRYSLLITRTLLLAIILFFVPFVSMAQFSGGDGSEDDPYGIATPEQLAQLATLVNENNADYNSKYYRLDADINLSDYGENFNDGKGWIPIGHNYYCSFKGHIDGNNKTISNLYVNNNEYDCTGLFGFINGSTAKNVEMKNVNVTGNNNVGSIAGYTYFANVTNCRSSGTIRGMGNFVGGVVGYIDNSVATKCYSSSSVRGVNNVGGVTSYVYGSVSDCHSSGIITASGEDAGGVVSYIAEDSEVTKCFFTGTVNGTGHFTGGVASYVHENSKITHCYSTGTINSTGNYVGGIVGSGYLALVSNCYATGAIHSSGSNVGGIMGDSFDCTLQNCAALNPSVKTTSNNVGRAAGFKSIYSILLNNAAWEGMLNSDNNSIWNNIGTDQIDGEDISALFVNTNNTIGGRFTNADGWVTESGMLPGFGKPVEMPEHLRLSNDLPPIITTENLPNGETGTTYNQILAAAGDSPITWTLENGNLPNGLTLTPEGIISGMPTIADTFIFTIKAENHAGNDTKEFSITIIDNMNISDNSQQQILKVYPNPVADILKIDCLMTDKARVEIYDSKGSVVQSFEMNDTKAETNISSLPSGVYLIRLTNSGGQVFSTVTQRFIKE